MNSSHHINPRLRVLFLCAMNRQRSPTAERMYRRDARLDVRSAGVRSEAERRVSAADLAWADVVFVMEREHRSRLLADFQGQELPPVEVLDIPDEYEFMSPELQRVLRLVVDPEIEALLTARRNASGGI